MQAARNDWVELAKFVSVAKNANAQLVIVMHKAYTGKDEQNIRDAVGYFVLNNLSNSEFNSLLDLKGADNAMWKAYSRPADKYSRVAIYDKDERKVYNKDYGDMIPLLPQAQDQPGNTPRNDPNFINTTPAKKARFE